MMKKYLLLSSGIFMISFMINAQDMPVPNAYFNFNADWLINDNILSDNATTVPDSSGNGLNAAWYNYNGNFPSPYSGFRADTGKWGGAAFFSGYKSHCDDDPDFPGANSPSSSRDILIFAGNENENGWDVIDSSAIWQGSRTAFTLAYWWKSDRDLTGNQTNACPPDQFPDWGEAETHFDGGSFNGIDIWNYYNYFQIGYRNGSEAVDVSHKTDYFVPANGTAPAKGEWVHVAVTFDGSTGDLTLYLNGTLAKDWEDKTSNPNPIPTGYDKFYGVDFPIDKGGSVLFGATNGPSPGGTGTNFFWGDAPQYDGKYGYIEDHYRLGWPARGYLDEFAYWKDVVLTQTQIEDIVNNEISSFFKTEPNNISNRYNQKTFSIYPNPSSGSFSVKFNQNITIDGNIKVINLIGEQVFEQSFKPGAEYMNMNLSLAPGLYLIKLESGSKSDVEKILIK